MNIRMEDSSKRLWTRFLQDAMENSPEFNDAMHKEKRLFRELASKGELGERVTVMCCGDGREMELLIDLQQEFANLKELNGVDLLPISIDQVREKIRGKMRQLDGVSVHLLQEDASNTSIAPNSQDTVTCMLTMVNFSDEFIARLCKHVKRILRPGGKFIFSVYNHAAFDARINLYTKVGAPIETAEPGSGFVTFEKGFEEAAFSRQFQADQIQRLIEDSGLNVHYKDSGGITHLEIAEKARVHYGHERIPLFQQMTIAASVAALVGISYLHNAKESAAQDKDSKIMEVAPGVYQRVSFKRN